jgi:hypothetical protein
MSNKIILDALRTIRNCNPGYDPESNALSTRLVLKLVNEELIYLVCKTDISYYRLTALGYKALENAK